MELVNVGRSIFDVISTLFTAVTFHELVKFAALDGNSRLSFGIQWQTILREVGDALGDPPNDFAFVAFVTSVQLGKFLELVLDLTFLSNSRWWRHHGRGIEGQVRRDGH